MDASKDKKEAPKGIIQSKNTMFIHQSASLSTNFKLFYCIILYMSRIDYIKNSAVLLLPFSCILVIKFYIKPALN
jgi:hypothetical protein